MARKNGIYGIIYINNLVHFYIWDPWQFVLFDDRHDRYRYFDMNLYKNVQNCIEQWLSIMKYSQIMPLPCQLSNLYHIKLQILPEFVLNVYQTF